VRRACREASRETRRLTTERNADAANKAERLDQPRARSARDQHYPYALDRRRPAGEVIRRREMAMLETLSKQAQIKSAAAAPPCAMVIFGAAGDLTKRLVVPALYNLTTTQQLPSGFQLVGVDRAAKSTQEWRTGLTETMKEFVGHQGEFAVDRINQ